MASEVTLRAIVEPEVDDRAAEEARGTIRDKLSDVSLKPDISKQQVRSGLGRAAGQTVGRRLPGKLGTAAGGVLGEKLAGSGVPSGSSQGGGSTEGPRDDESGESLVDLAIERNELLDDIEDAVSGEGSGSSISKMARPRSGPDGGGGVGGMPALAMAAGPALAAGLIAAAGLAAKKIGEGLYDAGRGLMDDMSDFEWPTIGEPDWLPIAITKPDWLPLKDTRDTKDKKDTKDKDPQEDTDGSPTGGVPTGIPTHIKDDDPTTGPEGKKAPTGDGSPVGIAEDVWNTVTGADPVEAAAGGTAAATGAALALKGGGTAAGGKGFGASSGLGAPIMPAALGRSEKVKKWLSDQVGGGPGEQTPESAHTRAETPTKTVMKGPKKAKPSNTQKVEGSVDVNVTVELDSSQNDKVAREVNRAVDEGLSDFERRLQRKMQRGGSY